MELAPCIPAWLGVAIQTAQEWGINRVVPGKFRPAALVVVAAGILVVLTLTQECLGWGDFWGQLAILTGGMTLGHAVGSQPVHALKAAGRRAAGAAGVLVALGLVVCTTWAQVDSTAVADVAASSGEILDDVKEAAKETGRTWMFLGLNFLTRLILKTVSKGR
jgi:voltage-gated potassium channel Kch